VPVVTVVNAYSEVRHALSDLRRTAPKGESFLTAMRDYVEEFGRSNNIETELRVENGSGPIRFPMLVEVHLQRVIQEALTNVRRHAGASRVNVHFKQNASEWILSVCDDGVGFDIDRLPELRQRSFGLVTMQERMQSVGGTLTVTSKPGLGTCVSAAVPINPEDQN
jgi:two-component system nitrate/nitrite sensor histidine kinase NarX